MYAILHVTFTLLQIHLQGGSVVSTVASQEKGSGFKPQFGQDFVVRS